MLARPQSIFLALVIITLVLGVIFPVWEKTNPETKETVKLTFSSLQKKEADKEPKRSSTMWLSLVVGVAASIAGASLWNHKNRVQQMKLGLLNSFVLMGVLGLMVYYSFQARALLPLPALDPFASYSLGFYMPIAAMIFNLISNRLIRRDEMKVRASDRMR